MSEISVEVDPAAADFVASHGGRLYVTLSSAGLIHETSTPKPGVNYSEIHAGRITLHVDPAIEQPTLWRLIYHRFPTPHVRALWNGAGGFTPAGGFASEWEGLSPFKAPWSPDPD